MKKPDFVSFVSTAIQSLISFLWAITIEPAKVVLLFLGELFVPIYTYSTIMKMMLPTSMRVLKYQHEVKKILDDELDQSLSVLEKVFDDVLAGKITRLRAQEYLRRYRYGIILKIWQAIATMIQWMKSLPVWYKHLNFENSVSEAKEQFQFWGKEVWVSMLEKMRTKQL